MPIPQPGWTPHDEALLHTCRLANLMITRGDPSQVPEVLAPFRPDVVGERLWASGPFSLWDWRPLGDGSWEKPRWSKAELVIGLTNFAPVTAVSRFVKIKRAADQAAEDAVARWVQIASGTLYTSTYRFYFYTFTPQPQIYPWHWEDVTSAELLGPRSLRFTATSEVGPVTWMLESDWAELVFVTWALTMHPKHPQLASGSWLPPGWIQHARSWHRQVPGIDSRR